MQRVGDHAPLTPPRGLGPLGDAQPRRRGTAVVVLLLVRRCASNAAHQPHGLHRAADAGQLGRAFAGARRRPELLLDDPVLARVVRQHRDPPTRHDGLDRRVDRRRQRVELAVDLDADRLERPLGGMTARTSGGRRNRAGDDRGQFGGRLDRSGVDDRPRDPRREALVAVLADHAAQLGLGIAVHDVARRPLGVGVHPHVERSVVPVREAALGAVELG